MTDLLRKQDSVVARRQLRRLGADDNTVARLLRRRELTTVYPGVYVDHTGPLSWEQRAWAAVLTHWPAALTRESALPHPAVRAPIHVAIDVRRTVTAVPGVRAHRTAGFASKVGPPASPPRIALEHAAIDVAAAAPEPRRAFQVFADVCQSRRTSPQRIASVLRERPRVSGRQLLLDMLDDLGTGACSVLEREYLRAVERRHGLPVGRRQHRAQANGRSVYRDVEYVGFAVVVELDGRAFHDSAAARDHDFERDLVAAVEAGVLTVRLAYGQVFATPCRTAARIARLLQQRGWSGRLTPCPDCTDS